MKLHIMDSFWSRFTRLSEPFKSNSDLERKYNGRDVISVEIVNMENALSQQCVSSSLPSCNSLPSYIRQCTSWVCMLTSYLRTQRREKITCYSFNIVTLQLRRQDITFIHFVQTCAFMSQGHNSLIYLWEDEW